MVADLGALDALRLREGYGACIMLKMSFLLTIFAAPQLYVKPKPSLELSFGLQ